MTAILDDGVITDDEREQLMAFLSNVIDFQVSYNLSEPDFEMLRQKYSIGGICAVSPQIQFDGRTFCFTGASYRGTRAEIAATITQLGGINQTSVSKKTDYLIVGDAGNPCWAYACYGRKVEEAMNLRKNGGKITLVNEQDFWSAVENQTVEAEGSVND